MYTGTDMCIHVYVYLHVYTHTHTYMYKNIYRCIYSHQEHIPFSNLRLQFQERHFKSITSVHKSITSIHKSM